MQNFKIGDTVTIGSEEDTLYIVSFVDKYSVTNTYGERIDRFEYELILVLPIGDTIQSKTVEQSKLVIYAEYESKMWNTMLEFVKRDRIKKGFKKEMDFLKIVEENRHIERNAGESYLPTVVRKIPIKINYDHFDTIDEGLDRLADVIMLYDLIQDKDLLKARKRVVKRLEKLSQNAKKK